MILKKFLLLLASFLLIAFAFEIKFRFDAVWHPYNDPYFFRYRPDPDVGIWMTDPDGTRPYINSFGMYDKERRLEKKKGVFRIAVLGDSMMNGVHAGLGHRMSDLLEQYLGPRVEVLNFGISSVGTVQELFIYHTKVRQFHPDLVILGFFTSNDVMNNSPLIDFTREYYFLKDSPYCEKTPDGNFIYHPASYKPSPPPPPKTLVRKIKDYLLIHSLAYRSLAIFIKDQWLPSVLSRIQRRKPEFPSWSSLPWFKHLVMYGTYSPPVDPEWQKAWEITEHTLLKLKKEVESDHAKFMLVILTDAIQIIPDSRKELHRLTGVVPPDDFDVDYPTNRIAQFCSKNNIDCINLLPRFRDYVKKHHLKKPYFTLKKNGHWGRLGHSVAAEIVSSYIRDHYQESFF